MVGVTLFEFASRKRSEIIVSVLEHMENGTTFFDATSFHVEAVQ